MKNSLYDIFAEKWGNDIYVYSDPHFGDFDSYKLRGLNIISEEQFNAHEPDITYEEVKESAVKQLDQMQIDNINKKCGRASTLIILGDIGDIECVKKLKAKYKILIMGNHDKGASNYKRVVKKEATTLQMSGFDDRPITIIKEGKVIEDNHLFDEVYEGPVQIGPKLILSHEPILNCTYALNIHGHMHSGCINDIYHLNVIGEMTDYTPMNLSKIVKNGYLKDIQDIHRQVIDKAIDKKAKDDK